MQIDKFQSRIEVVKKYAASGLPEWVISQCVQENQQGEFVLDSDRLSNLLYVKNRDPFQGDRVFED